MSNRSDLLAARQQLLEAARSIEAIGARVLGYADRRGALHLMHACEEIVHADRHLAAALDRPLDGVVEGIARVVA